MVLRKFLPVYLAIFIGFVGYSLMIAVFTPLFMQLKLPLLPTNTPLSTRTIWLGVALFLYPFGQFLSSPIIGALSDKFGRKPLLIVSLVASMIFYIGVALSLKFSILSLLCLFLFLAGLSEGNVTLAQSTIADQTSPKDRGRYFSYIYLSASLAYVVGPLIGGKLADKNLVSWFSYDLPFWTVAVLLTCNLFWIIFSVKEPHKKEKAHDIYLFEALLNIKNIFMYKRLRYLYAVNFLIYLSIFGFFRSYPMYIVDEFNVGVSRLSEVIAWVAVPIILVNLGLYGWLSKRLSSLKLIFISSFLVGIFSLVVILPKQFHALWITLFLASLSIAFCLPSCATFVSQNANPKEQGRVMGNNQSLQYFAESASGLVAGLLAALLVKLPLILFGISAICATGLLASILLLEKKS